MFALNTIKALAILLVTHSHMRDFYPIREITTGGMLGNTLFFFSSGIGITFGLDRHVEPFLRWYGKRIRRAYMQMWIVTALLLLCGIWSFAEARGLALLFLIPEHYWFLPAIVALYPLCYVLIRLDATTFYIGAIAIAGALYAVTYMNVVDFSRWNAEDHVALKTTFYFIVMVTGIYVARRHLSVPAEKPGILLLLAATIGFFGYLAFLKISGAYSLQAGANLLALAWALALFRWLRHPATEAWLRTHLRRPITFLSALTLPIYLVQVPLVTETRLYQLPFPLNVVVFGAAVFGLAWLLDRLMAAGTNWLRPKPAAAS